MLLVFLNFIFVSDDCEKYCKILEPLKIEGKIKSIDIDEKQNLIVFELNCNNTTKKVELFKNASAQRLYEHAKVGDKFQKDKDNLRINIIRVMNPMHIQVRYFDITCGNSK